MRMDWALERQKPDCNGRYGSSMPGVVQLVPYVQGWHAREPLPSMRKKPFLQTQSKALAPPTPSVVPCSRVHRVQTDAPALELYSPTPHGKQDRMLAE